MAAQDRNAWVESSCSFLVQLVLGHGDQQSIPGKICLTGSFEVCKDLHALKALRVWEKRLFGPNRVLGLGFGRPPHQRRQKRLFGPNRALGLNSLDSGWAFRRLGACGAGQRQCNSLFGPNRALGLGFGIRGGKKLIWAK